jgi:hypothetical protein
VSRWKREMSDSDRLRFEEVAGEMLTDLGYETVARTTGSPAPEAE